MEYLAVFRPDRELPRVRRASTQRHRTEKIRNREGIPTVTKKVCFCFIRNPPFRCIQPENLRESGKSYACPKPGGKTALRIFQKRKYPEKKSFHKTRFFRSSFARCRHNTRSDCPLFGCRLEEGTEVLPENHRYPPVLPRRK